MIKLSPRAARRLRQRETTALEVLGVATERAAALFDGVRRSLDDKGALVTRYTGADGRPRLAVDAVFLRSAERSVVEALNAAAVGMQFDQCVVDLAVRPVEHPRLMFVVLLHSPDVGRRGRLPLEWVENAAAWLEAGEEGRLSAWLGSLPTDAQLSATSELLGWARCDGPPVSLVQAQTARAAAFLPHARVLLLGAPVSSIEEERRTTLADLRSVALEIQPPPALAAITSSRGLSTPLLGARRREDPNAADYLVISIVADRYVPDIFPWQLIGPGHLAAIADGVRVDALPHGRAEVSVLELAGLADDGLESDEDDVPRGFRAARLSALRAFEPLLASGSVCATAAERLGRI